jgi:hypothetical protein
MGGCGNRQQFPPIQLSSPVDLVEKQSLTTINLTTPARDARGLGSRGSDPRRAPHRINSTAQHGGAVTQSRHGRGKRAGGREASPAARRWAGSRCPWRGSRHPCGPSLWLTPPSRSNGVKVDACGEGQLAVLRAGVAEAPAADSVPALVDSKHTARRWLAAGKERDGCWRSI